MLLELSLLFIFLFLSLSLLPPEPPSPPSPNSLTASITDVGPRSTHQHRALSLPQKTIRVFWTSFHVWSGNDQSLFFYYMTDASRDANEGHPAAFTHHSIKHQVSTKWVMSSFCLEAKQHGPIDALYLSYYRPKKDLLTNSLHLSAFQSECVSSGVLITKKRALLKLSFGGLNKIHVLFELYVYIVIKYLIWQHMLS